MEIQNKKTCIINGGTHSNVYFTLDKVFQQDDSQEKLFDEVAKITIDEVLNGYNGTIFAYGQSGSGKTYTMYGNDLFNDTKGIIPRCV